jgi:hypothetical protein
MLQSLLQPGNGHGSTLAQQRCSLDYLPDFDDGIGGTYKNL